MALKQPKKARVDFEAVLKLDPSCAAAHAFVEKADADEKRRARTGGGDGDGAAEDADDDEEEMDPYTVLGLTPKCSPGA